MIWPYYKDIFIFPYPSPLSYEKLWRNKKRRYFDRNNFSVIWSYGRNTEYFFITQAHGLVFGQKGLSSKGHRFESCLILDGSFCKLISKSDRNPTFKVSALVEWSEYPTPVQESLGSKPVRVKTFIHIFDGCSRITS